MPIRRSIAPQVCAKARQSGCLDGDLLFCLLRFRGFRQHHGEDALFEVSLDLIGIDAGRHLKSPHGPAR
jgi:hypothetical protein